MNRERIIEAMSQIGKNYSEDLSQGMETFVENILKGLPPKDAAGFPPQVVEGIYSRAYQLFNTGKYKPASQLFRILIMLDPPSPRSYLGLSACFHMLKEYKNAATSYALVSLVDPFDPMPYYHAADCYIQLDAPSVAKIQLKRAIELCGDNPKFAIIKDRSIFTLEGLNRSVNG